MPTLQPYQPYHRIKDTISTLEIIIPGRKKWSQVLFPAIWFFFGIMGGLVFSSIIIAGIFAFFSSVFTLVTNNPEKIDTGSLAISLFIGAITLLWLVRWINGMVSIVRLLIWYTIGTEAIEVNDQTICIARRVFGFEKPKGYLAEHIKNLRVAPTQRKIMWSRLNRRASLLRLPEGIIAFDYGSKMVRFGLDIDEAEGREILSAITKRFSVYKVGNE